jgi:hypothetical protein
VSKEPARPIAIKQMFQKRQNQSPESQREAYDVHLIRRDGQTEIFSRYDAA